MSVQPVTENAEETPGEVRMHDGTRWPLRMPPELWNALEFLKVVEGVSEEDLGLFALEEQLLHDCSFDLAYRAVVAHLAERWDA